jgi:hypothetical protein
MGHLWEMELAIELDLRIIAANLNKKNGKATEDGAEHRGGAIHSMPVS